MPAHLRLRLCLFAGALSLALGAFRAECQDESTTTLPVGYAVQDAATGEIVRRGVQLETGIRRGEVILASQFASFRVWVYDTGTRRLGFRDVETPDAGQSFSVDSVPLRHSASIDSDGDGLSDEAEMILGSRSRPIPTPTATG